MNIILEALLTSLALGALVWGFSRYRRRFIKLDLLASIGVACALFAIAYMPAIYDRVGTTLSIQRRVTTISMLASVVLLLSVFYLTSALRTTQSNLEDLTRTLSVDQTTNARQIDGESVYIVIPAYNEEDTIQSVVKSLPASVHGLEVVPVVVSDGSADATAQQAADAGAIVTEHPLNQGQGGALKTGFEIARRDGAAVVVTMDGDGQHPTAALEELIRPIVEDEADFVMGSRHRGTDHSENGIVRRSGIHAFTRLINALTQLSITDCTNGFRAIRSSSLETLRLAEERFSAPELIIEARKKGLRIREIPITIEERQAGETKKPQLKYAVGLLRTIIVTWIR
ncbi:glycosyl transferase family 2 [Halobacteriales archaeon QS_3_64_16]|nr:MAG: glycosyl transferase family 2 [Halobacteriales archaeon QS_3_64_16]